MVKKKNKTKKKKNAIYEKNKKKKTKQKGKADHRGNSEFLTEKYNCSKIPSILTLINVVDTDAGKKKCEIPIKMLKKTCFFLFSFSISNHRYIR